MLLSSTGRAARHAPVRSSRCKTIVPSRLPLISRRFGIVVRAEADTESDQRIKRTLEGLDALLGIDPNDPRASGGSSSKSSSTAVAPSPSDATRAASSSSPASPSTSTSNGVSSNGTASDDQFQKIIEKARQLADAQRSKPGQVEQQQQQLRQEFETLLQAMSKGNDMLDKDELKRLREAAFGPQTFWVTETVQVCLGSMGVP